MSGFDPGQDARNLVGEHSVDVHTDAETMSLTPLLLGSQVAPAKTGSN